MGQTKGRDKSCTVLWRWIAAALTRVGYAPIPCRTVAAAPVVLPAGGWRRYYPWRASPDQNRRAAGVLLRQVVSLNLVPNG
jgi:hypothetical protein